LTAVLHDPSTIRLFGVCSAQDAETLLQLLLAHPSADIDWRGCESAHAAVIQVLLVARRSLRGPPAGALLRRLVAPALGASN
jgi:hypothetical protein